MKLSGKFGVLATLSVLLVWTTPVTAGTLTESLAADFAANAAQENIDARRWQTGVPGSGALADGEIILKMEWQQLPAFTGSGPVSDLETFGGKLYAVTADNAGGAVYVNGGGEFKPLGVLRPGASFTSRDDERGLAFLQQFSRDGIDRLFATGGADTTVIRALNDAGDGFAGVFDLAAIDTGVTAITALGDFTDLFGDYFLMIGLRGGQRANTMWFEGRNWGPALNVASHVGAAQVDFVTGHEGFCFAAARGASIVTRDKFTRPITAADWGLPVAMLSSARFPGERDDLLLIGHAGATGGNLIRYARGRAFAASSFRTYAADTTPLGASVTRTSEATALGNDAYVVGNTDRASGVVLKYFADYDAWKLELETPAADRLFTACAFAGNAGEAVYAGGRNLEKKGIIFRGQYMPQGSFQSAWKEVAGGAAVVGDTVSFTGCLHDSDSISLLIELRNGSGNAAAAGTYTPNDRDAVIARNGNRVTVSWPFRTRGGSPAFTALRYKVLLATANGAYSPSVDSLRFDYHESAASAVVPAR